MPSTDKLTRSVLMKVYNVLFIHLLSSCMRIGVAGRATDLARHYCKFVGNWLGRTTIPLKS